MAMESVLRNNRKVIPCSLYCTTTDVHRKLTANSVRQRNGVITLVSKQEKTGLKVRSRYSYLEIK